MKTIFKIIVIIIVLAIIAIGFLLFYPVLTKGSPEDCKLGYEENVVNIVHDDFLHNRIPRWEQDKTVLGTDKPTLSFQRPKIDGDAYFVPFKATGPKASKEYFGMVDCKNLSVEYSSKS